MKLLIRLFLLFPLILFSQTSDYIHIDQFGYRTSNTKVAVISNPQIGFNASQSFTPSTSLEVKNSNTGDLVFSGNPIPWNGGNMHTQSGDIGWWFDFSSVTLPGDYYIFDPSNNESSAIFSIKDDVYDAILIASAKMFFYNRCGKEKITPFVLNGFQDPINFSQDLIARDVYDQTNVSTEKDMSGGWFDAGDYNKYVTFAESAVHDLLWAYQQNPTVFGDNWNIPESGNTIPDIIDEIKWETDWLLKMVNNDGSTHIKIGARNFSENAASPPSSNIDTRYYAPVCTSSSIAAAGMLAHASKVFGQFTSLSTNAQALEDEAILAWNWVLPYLSSNTLQVNCDDGAVVAGDADRTILEQREMALTAAVYLFDLTGDNQYNQYIINNINNTEVINNDQWDNYNITIIDALLNYTTLSNADTNTVNTILNSANSSASNNWSNYLEFNDFDLYRAFNNDWTYHWGSNSQKANMGVLNLIFDYYQIGNTNATYKLRAKEHLHYFHGVNPLGLVYLSNMSSFGAEKSINQIYHGWFNDGSIWDDAQTSTYGPAPGFVPGGSNPTYTANTNLSPPYDQPLQKSYLDFNTGFPDNAWEISEPGIYYQAAYVRLLSRIANLNEATLSIEENTISETQIKVHPNPVNDSFKIQTDKTYAVNIFISTITGQNILHQRVLTNQNINISHLQSGIYFLNVSGNNTEITYKLVKN